MISHHATVETAKIVKSSPGFDVNRSRPPASEMHVETAVGYGTTTERVPDRLTPIEYVAVLGEN